MIGTLVGQMRLSSSFGFEAKVVGCKSRGPWLPTGTTNARSFWLRGTSVFGLLSNRSSWHPNRVPSKGSGEFDRYIPVLCQRSHDFDRVDGWIYMCLGSQGLCHPPEVSGSAHVTAECISVWTKWRNTGQFVGGYTALRCKCIE